MTIVSDQVRQELLRQVEERALRLSRKVQGEDERADPDRPKGLPGKPLPPVSERDQRYFSTPESLARTAAHWREVMPPRFKGLLDAIARPLGEEAPLPTLEDQEAEG